MRIGKLVLKAMCLLVLFTNVSLAQNGLTEDFNDNVLTGWSGSSYYTLTETGQHLNIQTAEPASSYNLFSYSFPAQDLTSYPYIKINVKAPFDCVLRIDFQDVFNKSTNSAPVSLNVVGNNTYQTLTYNLNGKFNQTYPSSSTVDPTQINRIQIFVNPGSTAYTGKITFDDLLIGFNTGKAPPPGVIKMSQIGFYPNGPKVAVVTNAMASSFYVLSSNKKDTVYTGILGTSASFSSTGETVRKADFSSFTVPGKYYLKIPGVPLSGLFSIKPFVHSKVSKAGMKGFYYQRASMALTAPYAGVWARAEGHPDNVVLVHNSAASPSRPANSVISSPKGWYDAGDYNKYMVTAGISTNMILTMYEHYPSYFDTLKINIPEKNNGVADILDEALWELRWMLTMQDPYDGGVYFKLTSPDFDGFIMPASSTLDRYVVKKTTASTLDFAATMAQAARIFKVLESNFPGLSDSCIDASVNAWNWARKNPSVQYNQGALSSPNINTGSYGDNNFGDEFQWAAMELYATTQVDSFYTLAGSLTSINPPGWADVRALGYLSLSHLRKTLTPIADTTSINQKLINQANSLRSLTSSCPYGTTLANTWDFNWGSNGWAATQGVILLHAFDLTRDSTYLNAAVANLDYLMGRNGPQYCFLTGYGSMSPLFPHHRPSGADGIVAPVPGLLAGGPNTSSTNDCGSTLYPSSLAGSCYLDAECSYSTNEIAINWNAPFAYLSNVVEAIEAGVTAQSLTYVPVLPFVTATTSSSTNGIASLIVYPNPTKDKLTLEYSITSSSALISVLDCQGKLVFSKTSKIGGPQTEVLDLSLFKRGMYFLTITAGTGIETKKIILEE